MKIIITVACPIDGVIVQPDPFRTVEVREELARHLIAECKALPASIPLAPAPKKGKKNEK